MTQPPGFVHLDYPRHVCRLKKARYRLKQVSRAWFHRFSSFSLSHRFTCSNIDPSMFVLCTGGHTLIVLLYVDDVIITGSSLPMLTSFMTLLCRIFAMKDLGDLHYFLSVLVWNSSEFFSFAMKIC